jgi:hypothetical protein
MARKYIWSHDKYREVVAGNHAEGIEGLRTIAKGFSKAEGYDLRYIDKWSAYQKRKVREHFHRLELLLAQPKRIVRAKGRNLKKLQEAFHGGIPSESLKVAFIPDTEPQTTLPGAKKRAPRIRVLKEGVSIARNEYERILIPFDQKALVKNPRKEISRTAKAIPGASLYFVQVGEYQSLTGMSIGLITEQILKWMEQYDGKKALPSSSGNRGDDPKHHHWKYWLNGLVGYVLPRHVDIRRLGQIIHKGREKAQLEAQKRQNYMRRKRIRKKR